MTLRNFVVESPCGVCYRVGTTGTLRDAISQARRATRDIAHMLRDWRGISEFPGDAVRPYVEPMPPDEAQRLKGVMEFVARSVQAERIAEVARGSRA